MKLSIKELIIFIITIFILLTAVIVFSVLLRKNSKNSGLYMPLIVISGGLATLFLFTLILGII